MVITLDGGCRVTGLRDGEPQLDAGLRIWNHFRGVNIALRVIEGKGVIRSESEEVLYDIDGDEGIHLPPGAELHADGTYLGVRRLAAASKGAGKPAHSRLEDKPMQQTGDRFYRELIHGEITQFVGSIPPGRAPDHFHLYEEMLCILDGHGTMWAGKSSASIEKGSCIYLPRKQVHCVENRSDAHLRLLGVFYPAGSPAVRYGVHDHAEDAPDGGESDGGN